MDKHDPKVVKLTRAVAYKGEGFGPAGNLPTRINNPCDLELGDKGWGMQAGKTVFGPIPPNEGWEQGLANGWEAGYHEFWIMLSGLSKIYLLDWTFLQVAAKYTGNDNAEAWARDVTGEIGGIVSTNTLRDYLGAP